MCVTGAQGIRGASQVVKNPPANAGDMGSVPGSGRSPGEENGNLLLYSRLGSPMNRGAWRATVHGVEKSQTQLSTHLSAYTYEVNKSAEVFVGHFFVFNITGLEFPHFQNGIMPNSQIFVKYG